MAAFAVAAAARVAMGAVSASIGIAECSAARPLPGDDWLVTAAAARSPRRSSPIKATGAAAASFSAARTALRARDTRARAFSSDTPAAAATSS